MKGMILRAATVLAFLPTMLKGQDAATLGLLERLALRASLDTTFGKVAPQSKRIFIDTVMVGADHAPGGIPLGPRNSARNAALTAAFQARVGSRKDAVDCEPRPCKLKDVDVFVALSVPIVDGDAAHVTVTIEQPGMSRRGGLFYVTWNVHMTRIRGQWRVTRVDQLGIS